MDSILLSIRLLLSAVFGVAAAAKLSDREGTVKLLEDFGVAPPAIRNAGSWLLPVAELAAAVALIPEVSAWWGAAGVLALLVVFILAMLITLARGARPDCRCFGQLQSSPIGWKTIVRNVALSGLAGAVLWQGPEGVGPGPLGWWSALTPLGSVAAGFSMLYVTSAAFGIAVLAHLLKQNGRLMLRLDKLEAKLGVDPSALPEVPAFGLPVGDAAPVFTLESLDGRAVDLSDRFHQPLPVLLLFMEPGCGACDQVLPDIGRWQREYESKLQIVPVSRGAIDKNRAKAAEHQVSGLLLQKDREAAIAYMAEGSPSAVLVRNGRIASSVAAGADYIRALAKRALEPVPLARGESVPSRRVPNLDGSMFDLGELKGNRSLLVFWSPACGFCQRMKAALLEWERSRRAGAPELFVVSAGSVEAIHKEGFRSTVLLDPNFELAKAFGSRGTPSAVLIDEEGNIASAMAVGADAIFELTGKTSAGPDRSLAVAAR